MKQDHYEIVYVDEHKTPYVVFASTSLDALADIYAKMVQFEELFHTFPNSSCRLVLQKDCNYDPDLGASRFDSILPKWEVLVDSILNQYGHRLESPRG